MIKTALKRLFKGMFPVGQPWGVSADPAKCPAVIRPPRGGSAVQRPS